jgi:hypothetical protein
MDRLRVRLEPDRPAVHRWMRGLMRQPSNARYGGRQIRNELEQLRTALVRHVVLNRPVPGDRLSLSVTEEGEVLIGTGPREMTAHAPRALEAAGAAVVRPGAMEPYGPGGPEDEIGPQAPGIEWR